MFYHFSDFLVLGIVLTDILLQLGLCQSCLKSLFYPSLTPFFCILAYHICAVVTCIKLIFRQVKLWTPVKFILPVNFGPSYINYFAGYISI